MQRHPAAGKGELRARIAAILAAYAALSRNDAVGK
jgi:hypothetical protein